MHGNDMPLAANRHKSLLETWSLKSPVKNAPDISLDGKPFKARYSKPMRTLSKLEMYTFVDVVTQDTCAPHFLRSTLCEKSVNHSSGAPAKARDAKVRRKTSFDRARPAHRFAQKVGPGDQS